MSLKCGIVGLPNVGTDACHVKALAKLCIHTRLPIHFCDAALCQQTIARRSLCNPPIPSYLW